MTARPMVTGPPSVADLAAQVDTFRLAVAQAHARLTALTDGTDAFHRGPGVAARVAKLEGELQAATQGLRNAERILRTARDVMGADAPETA